MIFQKHPCATGMTLVTHQIHHASLKKSNLVKVGGPQKSAEQEFLPNSNSISALLAADKGPHGHQKVEKAQGGHQFWPSVLENLLNQV